MGPQGRAERQGDKSGDGDRASQGDGKLTEQNAGSAGLEGDGQEDHDQAGGDGQHGTRDFLHGQQAGIEGLHALLDVADDIFQHHDGVIDHDADGQHEREEGQDVDAVAEKIEKGEGAENRNGNRSCGDDRGTGIVQKEKDEHDDQQAGDSQGDHHLVDGVFHIQG